MADEQAEKPQAPEGSDGWVWLAHPGIDAAAHRVPDDPTVIDHYEARGWQRTNPPSEAAWVAPDPGPQLPPGTERDGWVELQHPDLDGRRHRFPADPAAVEAAQEAGWRPPEPEKPAKKTPRKAAEPASKTDTEE